MTPDNDRREDREDHTDIFHRLNLIDREGCPTGKATRRIAEDHEARIRRVEEIAIALGGLPVDHEKRIRGLEKGYWKAVGATGAVVGLVTFLVEKLWK